MTRPTIEELAKPEPNPSGEHSIINSLSHGDFKEAFSLLNRKTTEGLAQLNDTLSMSSLWQTAKLPDTSHIIEMPFAGADRLLPISGIKPGDISGKPGGDIFKYPLPIAGESGVVSGDSALAQLNQKIVDQAVKTVQERMTPQEIRQLNKDAVKYAEEMRKYEEAHKAEMMQEYFRTREDQWLQPPLMPESLKKYQDAVDQEIGKIATKLNH
jgi:hypothetical protein